MIIYKRNHKNAQSISILWAFAIKKLSNPGYIPFSTAHISFFSSYLPFLIGHISFFSSCLPFLSDHISFFSGYLPFLSGYIALSSGYKPLIRIYSSYSWWPIATTFNCHALQLPRPLGRGIKSLKKNTALAEPTFG